ncbi:SDR family NAD(P)-dependent oxidoreductase [Paenibacillus thalictri]|uniref:SDR family NAD(P)-dependent oxidoreductase n=1 Tax=Paenibacillus thalictri TaxID=2527873 RepID=UPI002692F0F0
MSVKPLLVIVGSGPGVSSGITSKFGGNGFRIVLVARNAASLESRVKELHEQHIEAYGVPADASDSNSLKTAFSHIQSVYGTVDVLVYNAANIVPGDPLSLTERQLIDDFKVNTVGALTSAQQVIPEMIERKQGTLFFTGGTLALKPNPKYASLSVGKAALHSLAQSLTATLSPHGIYVGQVLIGGYVQKGSFYDPERIADIFWDLYTTQSQTEVVFEES